MSGNPYSVLAERLEFPGSERLEAILRYFLTPQQATVCEGLPGTAQDLAAKTGLDAGVIGQELEDLFIRGMVFPRGDYAHREYFRFARRVEQFHDTSLVTNAVDIGKHRKFFELWKDFFDHEMGPRLAARAAIPEVPRSRIVPAYKSIKDLPGVLPYENYREIVKAQRRVVVVPCSCRALTTGIDDHCEHCDEEERWNCLQFGRSADYWAARGAAKELTMEEAMDLIDKIEDDGLIHQLRNHSSIEGLLAGCSCCRDCCGDYLSIDQAGLSIGVVWAKSRYAAYMESSDSCDGCQDCVDRCQFDAVTMVKVAGSKRLKATIDEDKCYGCGACVVGCKPTALKMKAVRPPEHIPVLAAAAAE